MELHQQSIGQRGSEAYLKLSDYAFKLGLKSYGPALDRIPNSYTLNEAKRHLKVLREYHCPLHLDQEKIGYVCDMCVIENACLKYRPAQNQEVK